MAVGSRRTWPRVCNARGPLPGPNPLHTRRYPSHPRTYRYHPDTLFCRPFCHFDRTGKIRFKQFPTVVTWPAFKRPSWWPRFVTVLCNNCCYRRVWKFQLERLSWSLVLCWGSRFASVEMKFFGGGGVKVWFLISVYDYWVERGWKRGW